MRQAAKARPAKWSLVMGSNAVSRARAPRGSRQAGTRRNRRLKSRFYLETGRMLFSSMLAQTAEPGRDANVPRATQAKVRLADPGGTVIGARHRGLSKVRFPACYRGSRCSDALTGAPR